MTFLGTLAGRGVQYLFGEMSAYAGFVALVAIGIYMIVESRPQPGVGIRS